MHELWYLPCVVLLLVDMSRNKLITSEQISQIIALHKVETATKDIANVVGLSERTVQRWVKKYKDGGSVELPTHIL